MGISPYECKACGGAYKRCARAANTNPAYPQSVTTRDKDKCKPGACKGGQDCFEATTMLEPKRLIAVKEGAAQSIVLPKAIPCVYDGYHSYPVISPKWLAAEQPGVAHDSASMQLTSGALIVPASSYFLLDSTREPSTPERAGEELVSRRVDFLLLADTWCRSCWHAAHPEGGAAPDDEGDNDDEDEDEEEEEEEEDDEDDEDEDEDPNGGEPEEFAPNADSGSDDSGSDAEVSPAKRQCINSSPAAAPAAPASGSSDADGAADAAASGPPAEVAVAVYYLDAIKPSPLVALRQRREEQYAAIASALGVAKHFSSQDWEADITAANEAVAAAQGDNAALTAAHSRLLNVRLYRALRSDRAADRAAAIPLLSQAVSAPPGAHPQATLVWPSYVGIYLKMAVSQGEEAATSDEALVEALLVALAHPATLSLKVSEYLTEEEEAAEAAADLDVATALAPMAEEERTEERRELLKKCSKSRSLRGVRAVLAAGADPTDQSCFDPPLLLCLVRDRFAARDAQALVPNSLAIFKLLVEEMQRRTGQPFDAHAFLGQSNYGVSGSVVDAALKQGHVEALQYLLGELKVPATLPMLRSAVNQSMSSIVALLFDRVHMTDSEAAAMLGVALLAASSRGLAYQSEGELATVRLIIGAHPGVQHCAVTTAKEGDDEEEEDDDSEDGDGSGGGGDATAKAGPRGALWALLGSYHARMEILTPLMKEYGCNVEGRIVATAPGSAGSGAGAATATATSELTLPSVHDTPLARAIESSHWAAAELLMQAGAQLSRVAPPLRQKFNAWKSSAASGGRGAFVFRFGRA